MPSYPPGTCLIIPSSQNYARLGEAALEAPHANYPAAQAIDGSSGTPARSVYETDALTVTLPDPAAVTVFGVINTNIDYGLVCGFTAFGAYARGAAARTPNFWVDMRLIDGTPVTADTFRFNVNFNSRPLTIGELVLGAGYQFTGSIRSPLIERVKVHQERAELEYGDLTINSAGDTFRTMTLDLSMTAAEYENFLIICDEAGTDGERVIVVPDTTRNDLWFVEWPSVFEVTFPASDQVDIEVSVELREEAGGVV